MGLCTLHRPQIMVLFLEAGHVHSTGIFCPPLYLSWAAPGKQKQRAFIRLRRKLQRVEEGIFNVHTVTQFSYYKHICLNQYIHK